MALSLSRHRAGSDTMLRLGIADDLLSCYAFKLEIWDRLEARPTKVLLIFDTQFKCITAYYHSVDIS